MFKSLTSRLSEHQIYFYTIPSLDPFPIKPVRNVVTFAVDDHHLKRSFPTLSAQGHPLPPEPVDFCVVKRHGIAMFTMKDRLVYTKVCSYLGNRASISCWKHVWRNSPFNKEASPSRNVLERSCVLQIRRTTACLTWRLCQCSKFSQFRRLLTPPHSSSNRWLPWLVPRNSLSFHGQVRARSDYSLPGMATPSEAHWSGWATQKPYVRHWWSFSFSLAHWNITGLDYPYITSLLPNNTIEVHSIDTQAIVQVIGAPPPPTSPSTSPTRKDGHVRSSSTSSKGETIDPQKRLNLISSVTGYLVPSTQRSDKMSTVPVKLLRP